MSPSSCLPPWPRFFLRCAHMPPGKDGNNDRLAAGSMSTVLAPEDKPERKMSLKKQFKEWRKGLSSPRTKDGVEKSKFSIFRSASTGGSAHSTPRGSATSSPTEGNSPHKDGIKAVCPDQPVCCYDAAVPDASQGRALQVLLT